MSGKTFISIEALGHYHPTNVISNDFFASLEIESDSTWIEERIGIRSRRSVFTPAQIADLRWKRRSLAEIRKDENVETAASMATKSWENLSQRFSANETFKPDVLIAGTSVPDFDIPSLACSVGAKLGWEAGCAFDVNSACSTFLAGLHVMRSLLVTSEKSEASGALFCPERYSMRLDYADRKSSIIFGDGASAAKIIKSSAPKGFEVIDTMMWSEPKGSSLITIPVNGTFDQNGAAVQKFAVQKTVAAAEAILKKNNLTTQDIGYFIAHQANLRMLESVVKRFQLREEQHLYNIVDFGNQGGAGAPTVLSMNWDKIEKGKIIVMAVVGSGLSWGSALLRRC